MKTVMTAEQQQDIKGFLDNAYNAGYIRQSDQFATTLHDYALYKHNIEVVDAPDEEKENAAVLRAHINEHFAPFGYTLDGPYFVKKIGEQGYADMDYRAVTGAAKSGFQKFVDEMFAKGDTDATKYVGALLKSFDAIGVETGFTERSARPKDLFPAIMKWGNEVMPQFGYKIVGSRLYKADQDPGDWITTEVREMITNRLTHRGLNHDGAGIVYTVLMFLKYLGVYTYLVTTDIVGAREKAKAYPQDVVDLFEKAGYRIDGEANRIVKLEKNATATNH